jgi:hypothetical protein
VGNYKTKKSFKENYYRQRTAMLVARASSLCMRFVDPLPTIDGIRLTVDASVDESFGDETIVEASDTGATIVDEGTPADSDIIDAELVDPETVSAQNETHQLVSQSWIRQWHAKCEEWKLTNDEKHAIIATATGGRCSSSVDIRESEKEAVKAELTAHLATRETSAA